MMMGRWTRVILRQARRGAVWAVVAALAVLFVALARGGDGGMLAYVALRQERVVAAAPRLAWADIMQQGDNLVVRLPQGWRIAPLAQGSIAQSMQPTLGPGHKVVYTPAQSYDIGDVVVFMSWEGVPELTKATAHRIVETGIDEKGWYAITKGDANFDRDPDKLRWEHILGVVLVVLH